MTERQPQNNKACSKGDSLGCYIKTRDQILKDMDKQAERFKTLHDKVTRKIAQGVRRYTDDAL
ncbi:MAG: hypothetical protein KUA35_09150 [Pseudodesulfovibrio sp.]|uniref:Uncharacterized protein n=1 Tax=Pseudodesulfovibrio aespoeensis (strain ATCC 700646 / DSM 10631 / Aspo-2) TaxID=643562 RepID=E6VXK7_PSEA9|nr:MULTISPECIES: hypothetical protein [Pseudodesulfovibrio]MBU4475236.1 hypothetical protein [Pseudomonadota bacterium]ADU61465.1 hypothetical protein Daes_0443 [Pseudodesulfovibrio aespoeensis Aspo-2]MBU4516275.1 hypothetical protein [Pseudomonadota bacterium]MBU4522454.1 hypothetical protein [Pseudomonadota bacterium]MBU4558656.1 hypothetical protein [Pseudomonadota bacterium]